MPVAESQQLAPAIVEAVSQAVETTLATICGARPERLADDAVPTSDIIGIITFVGDPSWSFSLLLPQDTATALIQAFVGMEIPFDSADMGDAVGEFANVLAGDIVARLESRRIEAQMSLPLVARGHDVKVYGAASVAHTRIAYRSAQGPFWVKMAAEGSGPMGTRQPGI
jgi:chemotaxis protein CheX